MTLVPGWRQAGDSVPVHVSLTTTWLGGCCGVERDEELWQTDLRAEVERRQESPVGIEGLCRIGSAFSSPSSNWTVPPSSRWARVTPLGASVGLRYALIERTTTLEPGPASRRYCRSRGEGVEVLDLIRTVVRVHQMQVERCGPR